MVCQSQIIKRENDGSNFIPSKQDDNAIEEKVSKRPNLVSWLGITKPNQGIGETQRQASNQDYQVIEIGPGVDVVYPLWSCGTLDQGPTTPWALAKGQLLNTWGMML